MQAPGRARHIPIHLWDGFCRCPHLHRRWSNLPKDLRTLASEPQGQGHRAREAAGVILQVPPDVAVGRPLRHFAAQRKYFLFIFSLYKLGHQRESLCAVTTGTAPPPGLSPPLRSTVLLPRTLSSPAPTSLCTKAEPGGRGPSETLCRAACNWGRGLTQARAPLADTHPDRPPCFGTVALSLQPCKAPGDVQKPPFPGSLGDELAPPLRLRPA